MAASMLAVALAGLAARTPLAGTYPVAAALLLLWIVSDAMMLALVARTPGHRPPRHAVLGALAAASIAVWLEASATLRQALLSMPAVIIAMIAAVLAHLLWAAARALHLLRSPGPAAKDRWITAASAFFPPALARLTAAELSVIRIALFSWGGPADAPAGSRAFSYHRHLTPICATLLTLSAIEVAVYHLLAAHWSHAAAIAMFVLSDVGLIYLVGLIKSFRLRPILMTSEGVRIRAGLLIDRTIPFGRITGVETGFTGTDIHDPATLNAALLAWPNILVRLDAPMARRALAWRRTPFSAVAFRLDDPEPFVRLLRWRLGQSGNGPSEPDR